MYKIILALLLSTLLNAELVNGVAIIVKGEAITLHDIREEMKKSNVDVNNAATFLIRKKLEEVEIKERKINVSTSEVYDDIRSSASRNNMSVSDFYEAIRGQTGMSSSEFKEKTKEKLLSQKLYAAIAYASIQTPTDTEIEEYFKLNIKQYEHASKFKVMVYTSSSKQSLQNKIANPMFFSADIQSQEQKLEYNKIPRDLAKYLNSTEVNTFSPIIPSGENSYMSFFILEKIDMVEVNLDMVRQQITNELMADKREQVLSDYFARQRGNADIKTIRMP